MYVPDPTLWPLIHVLQQLTVRMLHVIAMWSWGALRLCVGRRVCIDWRFNSTCHKGDTMTDMPFALYGPGLYAV